jgi:hypothetical protein
MADDKDREKRSSAPSTERQPAPAPQVEEQEQERPLNETVPGGRYIVGGQTVDAEGRPLTE